MRRDSRQPVERFTSHCNGHIIRGSAMQVSDRHDKLGKEAESAGDMAVAHVHYQHADHYNRLVAGTVNA